MRNQNSRTQQDLFWRARYAKQILSLLPNLSNSLRAVEKSLCNKKAKQIRVQSLTQAVPTGSARLVTRWTAMLQSHSTDYKRPYYPFWKDRISYYWHQWFLIPQIITTLSSICIHNWSRCSHCCSPASRPQEAEGRHSSALWLPTSCSAAGRTLLPAPATKLPPSSFLQRRTKVLREAKKNRKGKENPPSLPRKAEHDVHNFCYCTLGADTRKKSFSSAKVTELGSPGRITWLQWATVPHPAHGWQRKPCTLQISNSFRDMARPPRSLVLLSTPLPNFILVNCSTEKYSVKCNYSFWNWMLKKIRFMYSLHESGKLDNVLSLRKALTV